MTEPTTPEPAPLKRPWPSHLVDALTAAIDQLSPGDLAELRRLDADHPSCPAYWRLVLTYLDDKLTPGQERRWALVLAGMAQSQGLHTPRRRAGDALAAVTSEARFVRLLRAQGVQLHAALRHVVHQLATAAEPFDWTDLAALVLSEGNEHAERTRRRLARDFYAAERRLDAAAASPTSTEST